LRDRSCGNSNFASRTNCCRCQKPKEDSAVSSEQTDKSGTGDGGWSSGSIKNAGTIDWDNLDSNKSKPVEKPSYN
jgi:hypothetical protein